MILVESGWIALDDPVGNILPGFRGAGRDAITVRQLLTHSPVCRKTPISVSCRPMSAHATNCAHISTRRRWFRLAAKWSTAM